MVEIDGATVEFIETDLTEDRIQTSLGNLP